MTFLNSSTGSRHKLGIEFRAAAALCGFLLAVGPQCVAQEPNASQEAPPTIVVNVQKVLVPVVVRDKQGRAVGDLKKEDFQAFDDDKLRPVSGFTIEKRGETESGATTDMQPPVSSNGAPQPAIPQRFVVFLFDDMHLNADDLVHAQKAGVKAIDTSLADSDMAAVVSISGKTNSGLRS